MSAPRRTAQGAPASAARGQRAGNPTPRCQARALAGSPEPSALGQRRQRPGDLTWAGRGSSADKGMICTAPRRGVCSSSCLSSTESSSCSPREGGLSPSMDGGGAPGSPPGASGAHARVQSPQPAPGGRGRGLRAEPRKAVFLVCSALPAPPAPPAPPTSPSLSVQTRSPTAPTAGSAVPRKKAGIPPAGTWPSFHCLADVHSLNQQITTKQLLLPVSCEVLILWS